MKIPNAAPHSWVDEFPCAVTVCDSDGTITELNTMAREIFAENGGAALIGQNLLQCHPPRAQALVRELLSSGRSNMYTIQKDGRRKLIVQSPWYRDGEFSGIVELSIPLPDLIPHFDRDSTPGPLPSQQ